MTEKLGEPSGHIGSGSALLLIDGIPLATAEVRTSAIIDTLIASKIGIDISADQACTVKLVRLPDGVTPGEISDIGTVSADTPAFFLYTSLLCPAVKIVVENTGGTDMSSFNMYVRGGA